MQIMASGISAYLGGILGCGNQVTTNSAACSTGTEGVLMAYERIKSGEAERMLTGSCSDSGPYIWAGFDSLRILPSGHNEKPTLASRPMSASATGFVPGSGAGALVLESLEHARARGAEILCEISGYGTSDDAFHISAPAENGAGAALSMENALNNASLKPEEIGYINAHGTSTLLNDKSETAAIKTVFGKVAYQIPISSTKSMTGHLLGASGALEAVVCAQVFQNNLLPPTINYQTPDPECDLDYVPNQARPSSPDHIMSNSFGFGGHNATLILSRYKD